MIFEMIEVGPLGVNCLILGCATTHEGVVVDPGGNVDRIAEIVKRHGLKILYIINTHAHFDHVGGNLQAVQTFGAPLLIHAGDTELLGKSADVARMYGMPGESSPAPDRLLTDGMELEFGNHRIKVLHTPGHTQGGCCLYLEAEKKIITGDTLFADSIGRTDLPGGSHEQLLASIRTSRVKAMDETPIKAGRAGPGKMKGCYFWPVYGELDEICFPFFESRAHSNVEKVLGLSPVEGGVLLSDGYGAYEAYAGKTGLTHAQCWTHCRREFINAEAAEPALAAKALESIGALYALEAKIREAKLKGDAKREYRLDHARPIVEAFFGWVKDSLAAQGLLPSSPLTKALAYAHKRRAALEVFLTDPDVPIDTNHLERALRPIPMGRKNWMFSWTELGAQHVGVVQSLIATSRLHQVDPYDYLVDVLQRVGQHPAADVAQLTPRLWAQHFGKAPLRSDISRHVT